MAGKLGLLLAIALPVTACGQGGPGGSYRGRPPVANLESDTAGASVNGQVLFDASNSYDPDTFAAPAAAALASLVWSLSRPDSSTAELAKDGYTASLAIDVAGDYEVSITVTDDEGLADTTSLSFSAVPGTIDALLTWDIDISDVDLHLINVAAGGEFFEAPYDCYFANMNPDWGSPGPSGDPQLDSDINGYGPEHISVAIPESGMTYEVRVHYWSDDGLGGTNATIKVTLESVVVYEGSQFLETAGKTWIAGIIDTETMSFTYDGSIIDFTPL